MLELKNICEIMSGVAVRPSDGGNARFLRLADLSHLKAGTVPVLATGDAPGVARALSLREGDLVVGARGNVTDVCVVSDAIFGAFVSLDLYLVRPDTTKVDPNFLVAFLNLASTQALLDAGKQGTGLTRLPKESLETIEITLPAIPTQRLIGALAQTFKKEERLLSRLSELNAELGRIAIARAVRASNISESKRTTK